MSRSGIVHFGIWNPRTSKYRVLCRFVMNVDNYLMSKLEDRVTCGSCNRRIRILREDGYTLDKLYIQEVV